MNTRRILCLIVLCGVASAQNPEAVVLGGPCLAESDAGFPEWLGLVRRHGQALRRGDRESAVELAKQIVRSRCSNEHWWLKLAESLAEMDRLEESVAALDALYARESNAIDRRLRMPNSPLNRLLESDAYRRSALAARRAADRRALEKRRSEARAKLAAEPHPPIDYVAKHACPFECCGLGSWLVREDTTLYDSPERTRSVADVSKGQKVQPLVGEVLCVRCP